MGFLVIRLVREAVAFEELCGFEFVVVLGVGVLALYGFDEEARDYLAVFGEVADVSLKVVCDAHVSYEFPVLSYEFSV